LHTIHGIGNKTLWRIKKYFGSFQACWEADAHQLYASGIHSKVVENILLQKKQDPIRFYEQLTASGIRMSTVEDSEYPYELSNIFDPPYIIYYYGKIEILQGICIAEVGSRAATTYGKVLAHRFGKELAGHGITVVSGLARGIDTEAHLGALAAGGNTVAVLGCGLDQTYPPENKKLFQQICEEGLVISEFPIKTIPEPGNFPMRNRTISGLSKGVLVVEAKKKSGALITADFALEQGRDVFAIPGPISSKNSEGTNQLLKQGAILVSNIEDILEEYDMNDSNPLKEKIEQGQLFVLDNKESLVIECMGYEPIHFDQILTITHFSIGELSAVLMRLEAMGWVKGLQGNCYYKLKS